MAMSDAERQRKSREARKACATPTFPCPDDLESAIEALFARFGGPETCRMMLVVGHRTPGK
jgi:hypothetical protein